VNGVEALREGCATRELRLFLLACFATSLSVWAFMVVLAIAAYDAGGVGAVTLAIIASVLPGALAAPFTALLGDRSSRRAALVVLSACATAVLVLLTLVSAAGAPLAAILALAACISIITSAQRPSQAALLPGLAAGPRQLAASNGLWQMLGNAAFCIGSLAGGAAAAGLSVAAGAALTAAAAAVSLVAFALMRADVLPAHRAPRAGASVTAELLLGLRDVRAAPDLREAVGVLAVVSLLDGIMGVLVVVVAVELVGLGTGGVGLLNAAWGAGGLAGGFVALTLLARGRVSTALSVSVATIAVPLALLAAVAQPAVAVAGLVVLGVGYAVAETGGQMLVQRLASDETLARAFGVAETTSQGAVALGSVAAPLLIGALGVRGALLATAVFVPLVLVARWSAVERLDSQAVVPERELALLRSLDLFAPLPIATVETLALRAVPTEFEDGEEILRLGDAGDVFYVIAEGEVDVDAGAVSRREGPGEYFGEIALLRDVPRTAGVTAVGDVLLYALARDVFLAAVTGHVRSREAAQGVAESRLRASAARR
jgi:MFS family permease